MQHHYDAPASLAHPLLRPSDSKGQCGAAQGQEGLVVATVVGASQDSWVKHGLAGASGGSRWWRQPGLLGLVGAKQRPERGMGHSDSCKWNRP
eukprot:248982-Pyramimonas_sp.AAC.1